LSKADLLQKNHLLQIPPKFHNAKIRRIWEGYEDYGYQPLTVTFPGEVKLDFSIIPEVVLELW